MELKYKPCCDMRCCVAGCKTRSVGGCYHICRLVDAINSMKSVIDGSVICGGCAYIPDPKRRQEILDRMTPEVREREEHFRTVKLPLFSKNMKKNLKSTK